MESERRIKMQGYINMGDNVGECHPIHVLRYGASFIRALSYADMDLANHVVLVWHDPKFAAVF